MVLITANTLLLIIGCSGCISDLEHFLTDVALFICDADGNADVL